MPINTGKLKNWCIENITPQSWSRLCLRCVDIIRDKGLTVQQFENNPDIDLDEELFIHFKDALKGLYEIDIDVSEVE